MIYAALYKIVCMAYGQVLRPLLKKAVDDPESDHDEVIMSILDNLFGYHEGN